VPLALTFRTYHQWKEVCLASKSLSLFCPELKQKLNEKTVEDLSVSLSLILSKNEKVEYYIKIKVHKTIILRFWIESVINVLCD